MLRLSKPNGSRALIAERKPLTDLLPTELRGVFVRSLEPLLAYVQVEWKAQNAKSKREKEARWLRMFEADLAKARQNGRPVEVLERIVENTRKSLAKATARDEACTATLEAQHRRTPTEALALLEPPPPQPAPAPVHPGGGFRLPQGFSLDDFHAFIRQRRQQQRQQQYEWVEEEEKENNDDSTGIDAILQLPDVLSVIYECCGFGSGAKALGTTCRAGHKAFLEACACARVRYKHFAAPPVRIFACPRLVRLEILDGLLPPPPGWLRGCINPVAHRLVSLRLGLSSKQMYADIVLAHDWPALTELRIEGYGMLAYMAANPRAQGGHVPFPALLSLWIPQQSDLDAFAAFGKMAALGCFPLLRCVGDCTPWTYYWDQPKQASLALNTTGGVAPYMGAILDHSRDTEHLRASCHDPSFSLAFFAEGLAAALPGRFKTLRVLRLSLNTDQDPTDVQAAIPILALLHALSESPETAASIQVLGLRVYPSAVAWSGRPLNANSFPKLRDLELECPFAPDYLASILGAAGPSLQRLDLGSYSMNGLSFFQYGEIGAPAALPFPWMSLLTSLKLAIPPPSTTAALRAADRTLARMPALVTLSVTSDPADALLVLVIRQRMRGGLAWLSFLDLAYAGTTGAALLVLAFINTQRNGAARGLRFYNTCKDWRMHRTLARVLGNGWMD